MISRPLVSYQYLVVTFYWPEHRYVLCIKPLAAVTAALIPAQSGDVES